MASLGRKDGRQIGSLVGTQFGKVAAFARQLKIIHHFLWTAGKSWAWLLIRKAGTQGKSQANIAFFQNLIWI